MNVKKDIQNVSTILFWQKLKEKQPVYWFISTIISLLWLRVPFSVSFQDLFSGSTFENNFPGTSLRIWIGKFSGNFSRNWISFDCPWRDLFGGIEVLSSFYQILEWSYSCRKVVIFSLNYTCLRCLHEVLTTIKSQRKLLHSRYWTEIIL